MKLVKAMFMSALLSLGIPQAHADQTNVVQNVSIQLWGVQPGGPVTNRNIITTGLASARIDTRQVIKALGAATANTFSNPARLVIVTPFGGGDSVIQVRDSTKQVDVTGFFIHEQVSGPVSGSTLNTKTQKTVNQDYSIQRFALRDANGFPALGLHFDVSGFASEISAKPSGVGNLQIDAAGFGDAAGNPLILHGDIEVVGDRLEIVAGGSGPTT
jgi:hypothetical protein